MIAIVTQLHRLNFKTDYTKQYSKTYGLPNHRPSIDDKDTQKQKD